MKVTDAVLTRVGRLIERDNAPMGLLIHTRYAVERRIGRGGMAEIFLARDTRLNRPVAMKILASKLSDPEWAVRFEEEARTMGQIDHPGIVPIHDIGLLPDGRLYYTMKLIDGNTLDGLLGAGESRDRLLRLLARICEVVHHAHTKGIVHRDLKPSNIMVDDTDQVYVLDWGIARMMDEYRAAGGDSASMTDSMTSVGTVLGTIPYMPPEQAQGRNDAIDERSDVYSLGAVLYEILTELPPVSGEDVTQLLEKINRGKIAPPREYDPSIPADLERVCLKALAKNPRSRYSNAREFARDLHRWIAGDPVEAHPPSVTYRLRKRITRHRWISAAVAATVLSVLALGIYWFSHREDRALAEAKELEDSVFGPIKARVGQISATPEGYRRAIELVEGGLKRAPNAWEAWMLLGDFQSKAGLIEDSMSSFRKAYESNPNLGMAHYRRGRLLMEYYKERRDEAIGEFEEALRIDPENEFAMVGKARIAMLRQRYAEALDLCRKAKPKGSHLTDLSYVLGAIRVDERAGDLFDARKALGHFEDVVSRSPTFSAALNARGVAWHELGEREKALADYTRAIELVPGYALAYMNRGVARMEAREFEEARKDLDRAISLDPNHGDAYVNRGDLRRNQGSARGAVEDFDRAISLDPQNARAWSRRGAAKGNLGDRKGALADFKKALELDPALAEAYVNRGRFRYTLGEIDKAQAEYHKALELDSESWEALTNRGSARLDRGDVAGSLEDQKKAVELRPESPDVRANLSAALYAGGDIDGALREATEAIRLEPGQLTGHLNQGNALQAKGDRLGALAAYARAVEIDPEYADAHSNQAKVLHDLGRNKEALGFADRALKIRPNYVDALVHRGNIRRALKDPKGAIQDYTTAVELSPTRFDAYNGRGGVLAETGNLRASIRDFTRVIELRPKDPIGYANRGFLRDASGDKKGAAGDLRKSLELAPPAWPARAQVEQALRRLGS